MTEPNPGAGDVPINLAGEQVVLRPTLSACQKISRMNGGIMQTVARISQYDFDTIYAVVSVGIGKDAKNLGELVYKAGLQNLAAPCIRYCHIVANGGQPPEEDDGEGGDEGNGGEGATG